MKTTGLIRNMDYLGRLTIPKDIRVKLDIEITDPLEIFVDGESIVIKKHKQKPAGQQIDALVRALLESDTEVSERDCVKLFKLTEKLRGKVTAKGDLKDEI